MKLGNSVLRSGTASVRFGVAVPGRVRVRLYDVAGRVVRTLADRTYAASDEVQTLHWDGLDASGHVAARGGTSRASTTRRGLRSAGASSC